MDIKQNKDKLLEIIKKNNLDPSIFKNLGGQCSTKESTNDDYEQWSKTGLTTGVYYHNSYIEESFYFFYYNEDSKKFYKVTEEENCNFLAKKLIITDKEYCEANNVLLSLHSLTKFFEFDGYYFSSYNEVLVSQKNTLYELGYGYHKKGDLIVLTKGNSLYYGASIHQVCFFKQAIRSEKDREYFLDEFYVDKKGVPINQFLKEHGWFEINNNN